jgi:hypothetical protein
MGLFFLMFRIRDMPLNLQYMSGIQQHRGSRLGLPTKQGSGTLFGHSVSEHEKYNIRPAAGWHSTIEFHGNQAFSSVKAEALDGTHRISADPQRLCPILPSMAW